MTRALVIGASGGFGGAVARELLARGWEVRGLRRAGGRDPELAGLEPVDGDVHDRASVVEAARGCDVIVHGFNVPYPRWRREVAPALQNVIEAAAAQGQGEAVTVLFPGNVYGLGGAGYEAPLDEQTPRRAPTALGELRNELERQLRVAAEAGQLRALVLRAGDYFGPQVGGSWFSELTRRALSGGALLDPARRDDVPHAWAYLPDVARAAADLLERREALRSYEEVHFAGHVLTSAELCVALREALADPARRVRRFPWWALRLSSPFWSMGRQLLAMRYLWDAPLRLDEAKLRALLPAFRSTPLATAVRETLRAAAGQGRAWPATHAA